MSVLIITKTTINKPVFVSWVYAVAGKRTLCSHMQTINSTSALYIIFHSLYHYNYHEQVVRPMCAPLFCLSIPLIITVFIWKDHPCSLIYSAWEIYVVYCRSIRYNIVKKSTFWNFMNIVGITNISWNRC